MNIDDFDFNLPSDLIAQYPAKNRVDSRLLIGDSLKNENFSQLINHLQSGDLLVLNDTKVIPARIFAHKASGGKVEVMIDRIINESEALVMIKASRAPQISSKIIFDADNFATVLSKDGAFYQLKFNQSVLKLSKKIGRTPLPPYIKREPNHNSKNDDKTRYQSVFAEKEGAVAAPTASLHFDEKLLTAIKNKGINISKLTLHVGSGTFAPVKVNNILEHKMHYEYFEINQQTIDKIQHTKKNNGRVIAVGTTVVRVLETIAQDTKITDLKPQSGETNIFIYPPYNFKIVDNLITNFHLPKSTLLMLVSAFTGVDKIKQIYKYAIQEQYRFFSYGDAMFLKSID